MPDESLRKAAARALSGAPDLADLRVAIATWAPRFHDSLNEELRYGPRPELGMDIARISGRGALAARRGDSFFVGLGRVANRRERRFTLAHELAHVLLDEVDREALGIDEEAEERLCDLFARRALAPPALVARYLRQAGMPAELTDIDRFASRFRISLRASLVVLDEVFPAGWPVAFVAASHRPHPRRDGVLGVRIDVSAADSRRFFVPKHCRLATLGFERLEAWALEGELGAESAGRDDPVEVRSWQAGVSAWVGSSRWVARRHLAPASRAEADERGVLCKIHVDELVPQRSRRRRSLRSAPARASVAQVPGQLDLDPGSGLRRWAVPGSNQ